MAESKWVESLTETEKAFDCGVFMAGISVFLGNSDLDVATIAFAPKARGGEWGLIHSQKCAILQRLHDCPEMVADLWLEMGIDPSSDHGADLDDGDRAALAQIVEGRPALVARAKPMPGYGG